ncbi:hypothetical protein LEN26_001221 [Aphanomyces euteiches]|nr:hypothetical protein AeMF1_002472 [Aphanomyces euteiches]KAH9161868.1 hypothetical protein LEN26_001221 [Aphanomyces euteiches]KAH9192678.1 hypothetical protein AeNC1_005354 [Aphanomyces euteiches]
MPQPDAACWFGADHCFDATSAIALCAYMYGAAALFALIINVHRASMREHGRASMLLPARRIRFFPALLFIAFVNRAAWFILVDFHAMETRSSATAPYEHVVVREFNVTVDLYPVGVVIWEKLATLVYFSAFSLVVQFWSDVVAQSTTTSSRLSHQFLKTRTSSRTRNVLAIVNVWMYLVELSLLVMNTLQVKLPAPIVYPDSFVVAAFYGALSIMTGFYAVRLRQMLVTVEASKVQQIVATRVTIMGLFCSALFGIRCVLYLCTPSSSRIATTSPWIYYAMPELLPGCLVLVMMRVKHDPIHQRHGSSIASLKMRSELVPLLSADDVVSV